MTFAMPEMLLLIPIAFCVAWLRRRRGLLALPVPSLRSAFIENKTLISSFPDLLPPLALCLIALAAALPMRRTSESSDPTQGIDIMLVLDRSSSMRAEDMATAEGGRVSRMSAAIAAATGFVQSRRDDRVGLVVFARFPVTRSPLTVDGRLLREILGDIEPVGPGSIEDRTSIGDAIALACARLKETRAGGKAIVLASDGRNNAGRVSPDDAIALAKSLGIRIYAIGIGSPDTRSGSALDFLASTPTLDEDSLHRITETTGGRYFRAGDVRSLESAHKEINAIEKSPDGRTNLAEYAGLAPVFSSAALGVLAAWIALHAFFVRRLP